MGTRTMGETNAAGRGGHYTTALAADINRWQDFWDAQRVWA